MSSRPTIVPQSAAENTSAHSILELHELSGARIPHEAVDRR
jgi:hypothetical protein